MPRQTATFTLGHRLETSAQNTIGLTIQSVDVNYLNKRTHKYPNYKVPKNLLEPYLKLNKLELPSP